MIKPTLVFQKNEDRPSTVRDSFTSADQRLEAITEPGKQASAPAANYANATRWGDLVFISGKSAIGPVDGKAPFGKLGIEFSVEDGKAFARAAALELLLVLKNEIGSLDNVGKIIEVQGFVNADPSFEDHAKVLDGASDTFVEVLGEVGVHARSVFGAASLRGNHPVVLRAIVGCVQPVDSSQ